jgi:Ca2+-transporting ATPase
MQALALLFPPLRALLGIAPLGAVDALAIGLGATVPFFVNEATKPRRLATDAPDQSVSTHGGRTETMP